MNEGKQQRQPAASEAKRPAGGSLAEVAILREYRQTEEVKKMGNANGIKYTEAGRICRTCKKIKLQANLCHKCGEVVCVNCCIGSHQKPECKKHSFTCQYCNARYCEKCKGGCEDCDRGICSLCARKNREAQEARASQVFSPFELEILGSALAYNIECCTGQISDESLEVRQKLFDKVGGMLNAS